MGIEFYNTAMGHRFYEKEIPQIRKALENIHNELKRKNDMEEAAQETEAKKMPDELVGQLMDVVENFLCEEGVMLEESVPADRVLGTDPIILVGKHFDKLSEHFRIMLKRWDIIE